MSVQAATKSTDPGIVEQIEIFSNKNEIGILGMNFTSSNVGLSALISSLALLIIIKTKLY